MSIVSIVIPVYNAKEYIHCALDSIVGQTMSDWECVLVDDCSTDGVKAVLEQYVSKDSRFKLFSTPTNSGSAKIPLDLGVEKATSPFCVLMGCDDYLAPDFLEKLTVRQKETSADMVMCRITFTLADGTPLDNGVPRAGFDYGQVLSGKQAASLTIGSWQIGGNGALISKEVLRSREPIKNYMNADEYDTRVMLLHSNIVSFVHAEYFYRENPHSITRVIKEKLFDSIYVNKLLETLVEKTYGRQSPEYNQAVRCRIADLRLKKALLLRNRSKLDKGLYAKMTQLIKDNYHDLPKKYKVYDSPIKNVLLRSCYPLFVVTVILLQRK